MKVRGNGMNKKGFVYYNFMGLQILFRLKSRAMCIYCFFQFVHGLSYVAQVFFLQRFYDSVTLYGSSIIKVRNIYFNLLFVGVSYLLAQIMNGVSNSYGQVLNEAVQKELNGVLFQKIDLMDSIDFEHSEKLDSINKAVVGSKAVFWVSTALLDIVFFYFTYFGAMSYYLFSMQPLLGISTILIFIPNIISYFMQMISFRKLENEIAPLRRKNENYLAYMTDKEYVKETRILGIYHFYKERHENLLVKINELTMKLQCKKSVIDLVVRGMSVIFYGGIVLMLFYFTANHKITVGAFAAVFLSLKQFYGFMYELIVERFAWAAQNVVSLENYLSFVEGYQERKECCEYERGMEIVLQHVCFPYPSSSKLALEDVNLTIPYGQTVALVGENGSGKSTLCSIIEGVYTPDKGDVVLKMGESNEVNLTKGKRLTGISAVFQKFCRYSMTAKDNVIIIKFI